MVISDIELISFAIGQRPSFICCLSEDKSFLINDSSFDEINKCQQCKTLIMDVLAKQISLHNISPVSLWLQQWRVLCGISEKYN